MTVRDAEAPPQRRRGSGRVPLPPAPRDVPLPATFGDWYDVAASNLGAVQRRDSGGRRMLAGLVLVLGCLLGLGLATEPVLVLLGNGPDGAQADVASVVVGGLVLLGTLAWWTRYRRDWGRARRLRQGWALALRDPEVLALPTRTQATGPGVDPERMHDFRARELAELEPYPGVKPVDGFSGLLDALRAILYPLVLAVGLLLVVVGSDQDDLVDGATALSPGVVLLVVGLLASVRAWRRLADGWVVAGLEHDDRARWTGWRVLTGHEEAAAPRPWWRRLNLVFLPVAVGGLVVVVARSASGPTAGVDGVAIGVGIVVVPILLVYGSFVVRMMAGRVRARGVEVSVRVLADDVPPLGPEVVVPGPAVLDLGDAPTLRPADGAAVALDGAALVSGVPHMLASRRHWLMLADGSQVPLVCADVRRLQRLAGSAGLRVL
ncbi:hypothetical protein [Isoptericola cucumis]|uniref:Uncharacterized protein n=1 Tax=Isoptericola cucumis TaxID=1776856 RepID=A0ABQ2B9R2_9MICO|nr:hypothetical protein [Isoptericola cucumis]GGI09420.1 hypothetical protein GCM10007368_26090 [Isoptericola cucumis]